MLEDICIDAIVDNVGVLPDYAERLPRFLVKKVTINTINYRGALPPHRRRVDNTTSTEIDPVPHHDGAPADHHQQPPGGSEGGDKPKLLGLADLVAELIVNILSFLSHKDLLRVGQVCHQLFELSSDNFLWKRLCMSEAEGDDQQQHQHHDHLSLLSEEQVKQITYDNIEYQSSSSCLSSGSSPLFRSAAALKRRRKNKKKGKERNGRHSDYALLASMSKYLWKYFYFFGLSCLWHSYKYRTLPPTHPAQWNGMECKFTFPFL
jgi:hypothetical protein